MNDTEAFRPAFRSGFIAIAGAPNAGKSTLLNRLLGEKLSITSRKPQTTRNRILGVVHRPGAQMVFIDTPGVHKPKGELNLRIVDVALSTLGEVDQILLLADAAAPDTVSEAILVDKIKAVNRPVTLALNKTDIVAKERLLAVIDSWSKAFAFEAIVPVSARHGDQLDVLLAQIEKHLAPGPPFFPEDAITDVPERFIAAEIIREKAFRLTGEEIPYSVAVTVESFKQDPAQPLVTIHATLHVERDSQKGILIGKGGGKLRQIGEAARLDIQKLVGSKVFLKLFVRVQKHWSRDTRALRRFGY
jgi:GTP-binding protein Era